MTFGSFDLALVRVKACCGRLESSDDGVHPVLAALDAGGHDGRSDGRGGNGEGEIRDASAVTRLLKVRAGLGLLAAGCAITACSQGSGALSSCPSTATIDQTFGYSIDANSSVPTTVSSSINVTGCDYGNGTETSPYAAVSWAFRSAPFTGSGWKTVTGLGPTALSNTDTNGYPVLQFIGNGGEVVLIQSTGSLRQEVHLAHSLLRSGY